jgi:hypothetical protein
LLSADVATNDILMTLAIDMMMLRPVLVRPIFKNLIEILPENCR